MCNNQWSVISFNTSSEMSGTLNVFRIMNSRNVVFEYNYSGVVLGVTTDKCNALFPTPTL